MKEDVFREQKRAPRRLSPVLLRGARARGVADDEADGHDRHGDGADDVEGPELGHGRRDVHGRERRRRRVPERRRRRETDGRSARDEARRERIPRGRRDAGPRRPGGPATFSAAAAADPPSPARRREHPRGPAKFDGAAARGCLSEKHVFSRASQRRSESLDVQYCVAQSMAVRPSSLGAMGSFAPAPAATAQATAAQTSARARPMTRDGAGAGARRGRRQQRRRRKEAPLPWYQDLTRSAASASCSAASSSSTAPAACSAATSSASRAAATGSSTAPAWFERAGPHYVVNFGCPMPALKPRAAQPLGPLGAVCEDQPGSTPGGLRAADEVCTIDKSVEQPTKRALNVVFNSGARRGGGGGLVGLRRGAHRNLWLGRSTWPHERTAPPRSCHAAAAAGAPCGC